jgi:hypothetical protein
MTQNFICPQCGAENAMNARFCADCGARLAAEKSDSPKACSKCAAQNPANYRFCGMCGVKLNTNCPNCGSAVPADSRYCPSCAYLCGDGRYEA